MAMVAVMILIAAFLLFAPLPLHIGMICRDEQVWVRVAIRVADSSYPFFRWHGPGPNPQVLLGYFTGGSSKKAPVGGKMVDRLTAVLRSGRGLRLSVLMIVGSRSGALAWLIIAGRSAVTEVARGVVRSRLPEVKELDIVVQGKPGGDAMTMTASCIGHFQIGKVILSYSKG